MSYPAYYMHGGSSEPLSPTASLDLEALVDDELAQLLDNGEMQHFLDHDDLAVLDQIAFSVAGKHSSDREPPPFDRLSLSSHSPSSSPSPYLSLARPSKHEDAVHAADEGDKFDWASVAAVAILGPSSSCSSSTFSTATTATSSEATSPAHSPLSRSLQAEDKVEPRTPSPIALTTSIPSSTPSLTSSSSLHRLSSPSLSGRVHSLCASVIAGVAAGAYTQELMESVTALRQLLSTRSTAPFAMALSTPILPAFVSILQQPAAPAQLTLEVAWCLTNMASGSSEHVTQLVEAGVVDALLLHVRGGSHEQVVAQIVWCLGNIAGDSWQFRDLLLDKGLMQRICALSDDHVGGEGELLKHLCWTIHNLCRNKPCPAGSKVAVCIPTVKRLLLGKGAAGQVAPATADGELLPDLLWTLSCLSESSDGIRSRLLSEGFLGFLMDLLASLDTLSLVRLTPAIRTVGNFLTGTEQETEVVLDAGFVPLLARLLRYPTEQVRKEACWAASNVAAGSKEQKQRLFDEPGLLDDVLELSATAPGSVRKEATWVLCNLCEGGVSEQLDALIARGVLGVLTQGLLHPSEHIYPVAAAGLQCILRRDDRYKASEAWRACDATIRRDMMARLRVQHGPDLADLADDILAPLTHDEAAETRWAELLEKMTGEEADRLHMMRNILTMAKVVEDEGGSDGVYSQGEERRREDDEDDDDDDDTFRPRGSSASAASALVG